MSITDVLEKIGRQSNLKFSAEVNSSKLLTELFVPNVIQRALIANDQQALVKLLDIKPDIVCYISVPTKDRETPKDDNKPNPDDLPFPEESAQSKAGLSLVG